MKVVETIDSGKLGGSKDDSRKYIERYGNEVVTPFFEDLYKPRTPDSDKLVLEFIHYIIEHHEKFDKSETSDDHRKSFFNICKSVTFLSSQIISGDRNPGIVDKYVIKNVEGFQDSGIFKDLKYLQKVFDYTKPNSCPEEYLNVFNDIGHLKNIINLELSNESEDEKQKKRKEFLDVTKYSNIFTVAIINREIERLDNAKENIHNAISMLESLECSDDYGVKKVLFAIFRAVIITGEFASQKNCALQTKIDNPKIADHLEQIKKFTNKIVKPNKFNINNISIEQNPLLEELKKILESLKTLSKVLSELHQTNDYDKKVEYYTTPQEPEKPYLSEELIKNMQNFIGNNFELTTAQIQEIDNILHSSKKCYYITEIGSKLKEFDSTYIAKFNQRLNKEAAELKKQIMVFKPESSKSAPISEPSLISEIEKLLDLLRGEEIEESVENIKQATNNFFSALKSFLTPIDDLPKPMECDNPIGINTKQGLILEDSKDRLANDSVKWALTMSIPKTQKKGFMLNTKVIILESGHEMSRPNIEKAVESIYKFNKNEAVLFPKRYFGKDDAFVSKIEPDQQQISDLEYFIKYVSNNKQDVYEYIINYGKFCNLCFFISDEHNKLSLEFLLQTGYNLIKKKCELEGKETTLFPPEEYRALRHALRHHDDNMDVTEKPVQIEEIYAHYTTRLLEEGQLLLSGDNAELT